MTVILGDKRDGMPTVLGSMELQLTTFDLTALRQGGALKLRPVFRVGLGYDVDHFTLVQSKDDSNQYDDVYEKLDTFKEEVIAYLKGRP